MSSAAARPGGPSSIEASELLAVARLAARAAGAAPDEADDAAGTTAEKLTRKWNDRGVAKARKRGGRVWRTYIAVTAKNCFRDSVRSVDRDRRRQRAAADSPEQPPAERPGTHRSAQLPPSSLDIYVATLHVIELLDECGLTGRERSVLEFHIIHGLGTGQIAARLDISNQVVARHRRRALAKLRKRIAGA